MSRMRTEDAMANALIVGTGSGISAAVAHRLARSGYSVALAARRPETLASLAKEIGAHVVACDAAVREDVDQLFAGLRERWQRLDCGCHPPHDRSHGGQRFQNRHSTAR